VPTAPSLPRCQRSLCGGPCRVSGRALILLIPSPRHPRLLPVCRAQGEDGRRMADQDSGAVCVASAAVRRGYQAIFTRADDLTQDQVDWLHLDAILRPELHKAYPRPPPAKPRTWAAALPWLATSCCTGSRLGDIAWGLREGVVCGLAALVSLLHTCALFSLLRHHFYFPQTRSTWPTPAIACCCC
jgi:hypothetical protein